MKNLFFGKSIFLTGGTGFFGKNILKNIGVANKAYSSDIRVTILSRNPDRFVNEFPELVKGHKVSFISGDIRNFVLPSSIKFDYVIHGATEASAKLEKENPKEMYSLVVDGTKHLLKQIKGRGVDRLLFISSGAVYGEQPPELSHIHENFPCAPVTSYGKGKVEAEKLCLNSAIPNSIARCFAFVGPYLPLDTHFAIGNFILNGLKNEPIIIKGDGRPYRSYMYADDLAEWLWTILINGKNGEAYNIGSEEAISIANLAHLVSSCFDSKPEVKILGIPIQRSTLNTQHLIHHEPRTTNHKSSTNLPSRYVPSTHKAQKELGLALHTNLKDAILKTIKLHNY